MTEDWRNRGSTYTTAQQLPPMDLNAEHIFELMDVQLKPAQQTKYGLKDKIMLVWKEAGKTDNYHRVWITFNESYHEKAQLMKFLIAVSGRPVVPGVTVRLGDYLSIGMRISARLQARIDRNSGLPSGYYDFVSASIKPAHKTSPEPQQGGTASVLANAIKTSIGAVDYMDALSKLAAAKVTPEVAQAFIAADKAGQIKYPVS